MPCCAETASSATATTASPISCAAAHPKTERPKAARSAIAFLGSQTSSWPANQKSCFSWVTRQPACSSAKHHCTGTSKDKRKTLSCSQRTSPNHCNRASGFYTKKSMASWPCQCPIPQDSLGTEKHQTKNSGEKSEPNKWNSRLNSCLA